MEAVESKAEAKYDRQTCNGSIGQLGLCDDDGGGDRDESDGDGVEYDVSDDNVGDGDCGRACPNS